MVVPADKFKMAIEIVKAAYCANHTYYLDRYCTNAAYNDSGKCAETTQFITVMKALSLWLQDKPQGAVRELISNPEVSLLIDNNKEL